MVAVEVWDSPRRSSSMNRNTYLGIASSRFMGFEVTTNGTARSRRPDEESWLAPRGLPATRRHLARAFQCEQAALGGEATGVAAQAAVGCDHPVARDDDRDRIAPDRSARRARGALVPGALRHGRVRRQLPIGDARRRTEDASLERRESGEVHRDGERTALPGEVLVELARETAGAARIGHEARAVRPHQPREIGRRRLVSVVQRGDAVALRGGETQLRERHEAAISPRPVDRLVRRDLVQPRALGAATRWRPRAKGREEGLLVEVVSVVARTGQPKRVHEDLALVALDELAERESTYRHRPEGRTRKGPPM